MNCEYKPECKLTCPEKKEDCEKYRNNKHLDEIFQDVETCHIIASSKPDGLPDKLFQKGWRIL